MSQAYLTLPLRDPDALTIDSLIEILAYFKERHGGSTPVYGGNDQQLLGFNVKGQTLTSREPAEQRVVIYETRVCK